MSRDFLDQVQDAQFFNSTPRGGLSLLPDPDPRPIWCPLISVDDHLLEPSTLFDRVPAAFRDRVPQMDRDGQDRPVWVIDGHRISITGGNAASGRPITEWSELALDYDEIRPGVYDVDRRIADMDTNGVWASLNFPAIPFGFAGSGFSAMSDREAGLVAMQAYNDWILEEWCSPYPDRLIPCQIPWLADPVIGASEIRRNAARGFKAVSFSENPSGLGYPSIYTDHWDEFLGACEETETVINLHVGSSGSVTVTSPDAPIAVPVALFPLNGIQALLDWVFSKVCLRFPGLKITLSEGGASWVPMAIERIRRAHRQREAATYWHAGDPDPEEIVHQNFWFASIEDPSAFRLLDIIGEDRVMVESDYPHNDSSWPDTQALVREQLEHLPSTTIRKICFENAAELYRHPRPPDTMIAQSHFQQ